MGAVDYVILLPESKHSTCNPANLSFFSHLFFNCNRRESTYMLFGVFLASIMRCSCNRPFSGITNYDVIGIKSRY